MWRPDAAGCRTEQCGLRRTVPSLHVGAPTGSFDEEGVSRKEDAFCVSAKARALARLERQRLEFPQAADDILITDAVPFLQIRKP